MIKNPFDYEIFNIGNSTPVTLGELISTIEKVVGNKANIVRMPERKGEMQITYSRHWFQYARIK